MSLNDLNISPFVEAYLLSNNAYQLLKQYTVLVNPTALWTDLSPEAIAKEFNEYAEAGLQDFESMLKAYIILVGVTKLERKDADAILNMLSLEPLQWGLQIKAFHQQDARGVSLRNMAVGPMKQYNELQSDRQTIRRRKFGPRPETRPYLSSTSSGGTSLRELKK